MVTSITPSSGPPGTHIAVDGVGLGCIDHMDYRQGYTDFYTYKNSDWIIFNDTHFETTIPTNSDHGGPLSLAAGDCVGTLIIGPCCQARLVGGPFTITGAPPQCP
jgi:hypothetical protein